jgi:hypothetical protein
MTKKTGFCARVPEKSAGATRSFDNLPGTLKAHAAEDGLPGAMPARIGTMCADSTECLLVTMRGP